MSKSKQEDSSADDLATNNAKSKSLPNAIRAMEVPEHKVDEFGLPLRPASRSRPAATSPDTSDDDDDAFHDANDQANDSPTTAAGEPVIQQGKGTDNEQEQHTEQKQDESVQAKSMVNEHDTSHELPHMKLSQTTQEITGFPERSSSRQPNTTGGEQETTNAVTEATQDAQVSAPGSPGTVRSRSYTGTSKRSSYPAIMHKKEASGSVPAVSEWSHQTLAPKHEDSDEEEEVEWQAMTAIDEYDVFDDEGRLVAKGMRQVDEDSKSPYMYMAGAGKGYTRVLDDEDAKSTTSLDEDTDYLFQKPQRKKEVGKLEDLDEDEDDDLTDDERDTTTQLEATKDLLTEGQRIAYVGVVRLTIFKMLQALVNVQATRSTKKDMLKSHESMEMWGQGIMVRLYKHMDIDSAEQVMIEQLAEHGLEAGDLVPPLMQNAKVKNPLVEAKNKDEAKDSGQERLSSDTTSLSQASTAADSNLKEVTAGEEVPEVHGVEDMPSTEKIELDIRWTVLCDLFLVLLEGGIYDARSRRLLERVGSALKISWIQVCRFEKRVTDQLEMQEAAKEDWDESEHIEDRRKKGLKRKYMVMGLATVGGGLVIGLSAGLLAPVIGAGLAAGFTTIGVGGTAGFLGGVGGAALITSAATAAGGTIAVRASHRRTGHVQTFEYRPLHNNKKLNLILTVSGWMTGKVDDVRLPFSTVDPIMGDIYSLLWEPEMLRSMGDTINILATEALTQTVQQVLGSTILVALMASLQLPIVLTKLAYLIDNPWTVSLDRANSAGLILADSLIARHLGQRPITLLGFSLGSRVIFSCLKELANRNAYGIIQNVYVFGSPIVAKKDEWLRARSVIAGRFVNGYASNDWILGYLFRATSGGIMKVAGLAKVEDIPGLENIDVTELVNGHMAYRSAMPKLLIKVGWEVESDEFTEIEDPDPENHAQRQRELIREIDEARKLAEEKPERKRFGLFSRGKLAKKEGWETYETKKSPTVAVNSDGSPDPNANILFDIDAIRKELISEQIEVRELDSTLPPMQFTTVQNGEKKTEYLRLPPEISSEEVAKMKLPPRPDELNDPTPPLIKKKTQEVHTRQIVEPESKKSHDEEVFAQPRELVSTLPTLKVPSSRPSTSTEDSQPERPSLKKHETEPVGLGLSKANLSAIDYNPELEDNAWADSAKSGEIKMTFE